MSHPKTFEELIKAHGQVALELSGAGQSAWNGIVKETDNGVLGVADWNGTLELDQPTVTDPLRKMYATPQAQHDAATLDEFRDAFATMLHEQSHFFGPVGATQQEAKVAFQTPSAQQLEEGVTEAWTQDHLDEYLTKLGADQIAPGIENAYAQKAYPEYVPAARELAAGIGARTGQGEAEVLTALNAQTAAGQWSTATDLLYNSSKLPQLVPPDQEANVKNTIEQVMRTEFGRVDNLSNVAGHNKEILSAAIGQDTVTAGLAEIHRQEQTFAPPDASTVQTLAVQNQATLTAAPQTGPSLGPQDSTVENTGNGQGGTTAGQGNRVPAAMTAAGVGTDRAPDGRRDPAAGGGADRGCRAGQGTEPGGRAGRRPAHGRRRGRGTEPGHRTGGGTELGHRTGRGTEPGHRTGRCPERGRRARRDAACGCRAGRGGGGYESGVGVGSGWAAAVGAASAVEPERLRESAWRRTGRRAVAWGGAADGWAW